MNTHYVDWKHLTLTVIRAFYRLTDRVCALQRHLYTTILCTKCLCHNTSWDICTHTYTNGQGSPSSAAHVLNNFLQTFHDLLWHFFTHGNMLPSWGNSHAQNYDTFKVNGDIMRSILHHKMLCPFITQTGTAKVAKQPQNLWHSRKCHIIWGLISV